MRPYVKQIIDLFLFMMLLSNYGFIERSFANS